MSWTLCTSGAAIAGAGFHAYSVGTSSALLDMFNGWSDQAEGRVCAECHTDFVTNTPADTQIQNALSDVTAAMISKKIIGYDPTGFLRREADTLMNLNDDIELKGLKILKEKENQRFSS